MSLCVEITDIVYILVMWDMGRSGHHIGSDLIRSDPIRINRIESDRIRLPDPIESRRLDLSDFESDRIKSDPIRSFFSFF